MLCDGNRTFFFNARPGTNLSEIFNCSQVLVRNIPPDPDESTSELAEHFFLVNHPDQYLTHQVGSC